MLCKEITITMKFSHQTYSVHLPVASSLVEAQLVLLLAITLVGQGTRTVERLGSELQ